MKTLKPLELNRRLMLSPMASADVSALVFSQMATGRWLLDVEWASRRWTGSIPLVLSRRKGSGSSYKYLNTSHHP